MRRVFPLRPAETSLLVTYDNGTFEYEAAHSFPDPASSSSARNLKHHRRRSSTNLSVDKLLSLPSSPRKLPSQKLPSSSDYPEFTEVASPSPPSSLWTSSFRDDEESTSFNFSDGNHRRRHRHASDTSSSSSSSVNFNPADTRSCSAISAIKNVDALLDTANSSDKALNHRPNLGDTGLKTHLHVKTRISDVDSRAAKPTLKALVFADPQALVQPETPTYVIPEKVKECMQNCLGMPPKVAPSLSSASTPKASNKPHELFGDRRHLSRAESSPRRQFVSKSPIYRKDAQSCNCSTPFKYLTKCLRADKDKRPVSKEGSVRQPNSPAKFSTLTNRLYSPQLSPRRRSPLEHALDATTATPRSPQRRDASSATLKFRSRDGAGSQVSDAQSVSGENWKSPLKCRSFGSSLVNDYVRRLQEEGKSTSFRKTLSSASFQYDSDSGHSKVSRPQAGSMDFTPKSTNFDKELNCSSSKVSEKRLGASLAEVLKRRPCSMDVSRRLDRDDSICSSETECDNPSLEYSSSSDLVAAEEKNSESLALLRHEINKLCKEKRLLAKELAVEMKARQHMQESAENIIKQVEAEMEEKLISVEKDHAYVQVCLEQEMERRKKEWSAKLDKIRIEENRLRNRVTDMAVERVELQKAIALYKSREASLQAQAKDHELSAQTWMRRHRQSEEEVMLLRSSFTNACNRLGDKEHEFDLLLQRSKALERENAGLAKEISRLRKAYADQVVTVEELWQGLVEIVNGPSDSKLDSLRRLHGELKAFAVREQALRYEMAVLQLQFLQTKQRPRSGDESLVLSSSRVCSPKEQFRASKNLTWKSLESVENLVNKLELTKQHTQQVERQLEVKEEEVELLHSALEEREVIVKDLQAELTSIKVQRDGLRKQVQEMSQEAIRLTRDVTELKQVVEKLDDELMLKEGEISILRDACSDSDF